MRSCSCNYFFGLYLVLQFVHQLLSQTKRAACRILPLRVCNLRIFKSFNCSSRWLYFSSDSSHLGLWGQSHLALVLSLCTSMYDTSLLVLIDEFDVWWGHEFTLMSWWALQGRVTLDSNCCNFTWSMAGYRVCLFLSYPCRCRLRFYSDSQLGRALAQVGTTSSLHCSSTLAPAGGPLPDLIYTFPCSLLFILAISISRSCNWARLILQ